MSITNDDEFCFLWFEFQFHTAHPLFLWSSARNNWMPSTYRWRVTLKLEIMRQNRDSVKGIKGGDPGQNLGEHHRRVTTLLTVNLLSVVCEIGFVPHQQSAINTNPIPEAVKQIVVNSIKCC